MRRAYTLLEITVVLTILGLIVAAASIRLAPAVHKARYEHAIGELLTFEQQVRSYCRKSKTSGELLFDLEKNLVTADFEVRDSRMLNTSGALDLSAIYTANEIATDSVVSIFISQTAESATYAIESKMPSGKSPRLVLLAGVTGQPSFFESSEDVQALLHALLSPRPIAD